MASGRCCGSHHQEAQGTHTDAACLGMGAGKGMGQKPHGGKSGPAGRQGQKGYMNPQGPCHPASATPSAGGKGKGPARGVWYGSGAWPRYLVGPGVVHREGQGAGMRGAASVERAVGLSWGLLTGHGVRSPAALCLSQGTVLGKWGWGWALPLSTSGRSWLGIRMIPKS